MQIETPRFRLRDFLEDDRQSFVDYQMNPRYRNLYDFADSDATRANELFNLFSDWREQDPRQNYQLGIFERRNSQLCGCAGLRQLGQPEGIAVLGLELPPDHWGRFGMAIEIAAALLEHGFSVLNLDTIVGATASGNSRAARIAHWFGADIVVYRDGPEWMKARGWKEVGWAISHSAWKMSRAALCQTGGTLEPNAETSGGGRRCGGSSEFK
jgi:ribosomal-protein-alanine N-acetyltransferase